MLENFIAMPRGKACWSCCCRELVLSASGPGRKKHTGWLGSEAAFHAGRCFQVLTKAVGMRE